MLSIVRKHPFLGPLHYEMVVHVLTSLPLKDVFAFVSTSKANHKIKSMRVLWKLLFERDFPWCEVEPKVYRAAYKRCFFDVKKLSEMIFDPIQSVDEVIHDITVNQMSIYLGKREFPLYLEDEDCISEYDEFFGCEEDSFTYIPITHVEITQRKDKMVEFCDYLKSPTLPLIERSCDEFTLSINEARGAIEKYFLEGYYVVKYTTMGEEESKLFRGFANKGLVYF